MAPPPLKRPGSMSDDDRALAGAQRRKSAPLGVPVVAVAEEPVPETFGEEEPSTVHPIERRRQIRAARPTDVRFEKLEEKHDRLDEKVDGIDQRTARMEGKLDTALSLVAGAQKTEQVRIGSRAKVIIAIVGAIGAALGVIVSAIAAGRA